MNQNCNRDAYTGWEQKRQIKRRSTTKKHVKRLKEGKESQGNYVDVEVFYVGWTVHATEVK